MYTTLGAGDIEEYKRQYQPYLVLVLFSFSPASGFLHLFWVRLAAEFLLGPDAWVGVIITLSAKSRLLWVLFWP